MNWEILFSPLIYPRYSFCHLYPRYNLYHWYPEYNFYLAPRAINLSKDESKTTTHQIMMWFCFTPTTNSVLVQVGGGIPNLTLEGVHSGTQWSWSQCTQYPVCTKCERATITLGTHWVWTEDVRGDRMHGVIRLSNMIELLPPPLAEGALGDTIGGVACSREGGQLNSPPSYRCRSVLGGCCLLKRWRASECNLTPLKGILIISPLAGSELGDTIFPTCISKI